MIPMGGAIQMSVATAVTKHLDIDVRFLLFCPLPGGIKNLISLFSVS
jgi:hypothetical protein